MKVETDVEVTETVCHEDKIAHLQMIQGVIDRMSTSAAIYKGFAATIVTGIAAISFTEVSAWILLIAFFFSRMFSSNGYILPQIGKAV